MQVFLQEAGEGLGRTLHISFRGTVTSDNWGTDFDTVPVPYIFPARALAKTKYAADGCKEEFTVHQGFLKVRCCG